MSVLKFNRKAGEFQNSTKSNRINLETLSAWSYKTKYLAMINNTLVFNDTRFSVSTSRHQHDCKMLLTVPPRVYLKFTKQCLSSPIKAINEEIEGAEKQITKLNELMNKKGTRASTNEKRSREVLELKDHIEKLKKIKKD